MSDLSVVFLNPRTCGIYKNGQPRFRTDRSTGRRTEDIDNELLDAVNAYLEGVNSPGQASVLLSAAYQRRVLVPTYFDQRYNDGIAELLRELNTEGVSLGELFDSNTLTVRGGHGSPSNDQRHGHIPYVKVSDIRALRVNVNPTNLVSDPVARRFWRGTSSGLRAWDLITPNRASSNIGEFAMLLPGEEEIVLTKEVFILRVSDSAELWDPYYLLWALSLRAVRDQWRRIALMQTNREDCGDRYREIIVPQPLSTEWAARCSISFRGYFTRLAAAREQFVHDMNDDGFEYVANVRAVAVVDAVDPADGIDEPPA